MLNLLTLLVIFTNQAFASFPQGTSVEKISGSVIHFSNDIKIDTKLYELQFISFLKSGDLPDSESARSVLISAKSCKDCSDPKSLYLFRADKKQRQYQFVYPGKIVDLKSRAVVYDSRAFYGKCLLDQKDVYVSFQREHVDRRRGMQSSVFIAEPSETFLKERLIEKRAPKIQTTLNYVKRKTCFEIQGFTRTSSSKKIDLRPKAKDAKDPDEDDDKDEEEDDKKDGEVKPTEPQPSSDRDE